MIRTKILPRQRNPGFLFHDHDQCNDHTHKLRQSSTKRSPNRSKAKISHKQIIQPDIHHTRNCNKIHRTFGIPEPTKNRTDNVIRRNTRNPNKTHRKISHSSSYRFRRGRHHRYNWMNKKKQDHHQPNSNSHKQSNRVSNRPGSTFFVPGTDCLCNGNRRTHGKTDDHNSDHMHNLAADRDSSSTRDSLKLTNDKKVSHAI